jgi:competence protein ComEC
VATAAGWRAIAVCAAFAAGVALVAAIQPPPAFALAPLLLGVGTSVLFGTRRRSTAVLFPLVLGVACAAGVARGAAADASGHGWAEATHNGPAILLGTVRDGTGARRNVSQVVVDVDRIVHSDTDIPAHAGVLATLRSGPSVLPGDRVRLDVGGLRPPGSGVAGDILEREGIDAVAQSATLTVQATGGPSPARFLAVARTRLGAAVDAALPEPAASLLVGIVFGIHRTLPADLTTAMQDAGLAHILAISGLKVVLVAGLASAICAALALSPRLRLVATASSVGGYVLLCGATPPAVRSAVMAGAGWSLYGTGRVPDPLPLLAATAAAMLVVDPGLCRDVGFQLSFLGTIGILLLAAPLSSRLPGPRLVREPFAMTIAAQAATLPVMASTFGVVSLVGPFANALAVPLLAPLIVTGFVGAAVAVALPSAGTIALAAASGLASLVGTIATRAAALPFAAVHVSAWPHLYVVAEICALVVAAATWYALRRRRHVWSVATASRTDLGPLGERATASSTQPRRDAPRRAPRIHLSRRTAAVGACMAALATGAAVVGLGSLPDGRLHIAVLNVGAARAVAVRTASGDNALVDTGADAPHLLAALGPALPPLTRSLGMLVLTGGDRTAAGGLAGLGDRYQIQRAMVPAQGLGSAVRTALSALHDRGADVEPVPPDSTWTWGGATWSMLSPDGAADEGLALAIADPSGRALLLGNLTAVAQEELAALRGPGLAADLLVTPSDGALAPALLDAVRPCLIAVPDARSPRGTTHSLLSGAATRHTADAGTLDYTGSDGGLFAT